jgi:hypothetical protein
VLTSTTCFSTAFSGCAGGRKDSSASKGRVPSSLLSSGVNLEALRFEDAVDRAELFEARDAAELRREASLEGGFEMSEASEDEPRAEGGRARLGMDMDEGA